MKTKAVYVVVSGDKDVYFEQAWVSAWSLKHYNPDMRVECVVDQNTYDNILKSYRKNALKVIDEIIKIDVPQELNNKIRSRWLKTSLRQHVKGDYVFIDSDTTICGSLSELDSMDGEILMVKDYHCFLSERKEGEGSKRNVETIFKIPYKSDLYYNSGVILVKDTPITHQFYSNWHRNWEYSVTCGTFTDQQSLAITVQDSDICKELDGIYNCQIRATIKYLYAAKIIHYFNSKSKKNLSHPLYTWDKYEDVKKMGQLTPEIQRIALNCKQEFAKDTWIMSGQELKVKNSYAGILLFDSFFNYPILYKCLNVCSRAIIILLSILKKS